MNSSIVQAIKDKKALELYYHGFSRIIEPHACGIDNDGNEVLRCYQTSGGSAKGESVGWKLLKVNEIFSLSVMQQDFTPREDYKRDDNVMEYIIAQL